MDIRITQLVGIVPKNTKGTSKDGFTWDHDHVELHILKKLAGNDSVGSSSSTMTLPDCKKWFEICKGLVGKEVHIEYEATTNGKQKDSETALSIKAYKS